MEYKDEDATKSDVKEQINVDFEVIIGNIFANNQVYQINGWAQLDKIAKKHPHLFKDYALLTELVKILDRDCYDFVNNEGYCTRHDLFFELLSVIVDSKCEDVIRPVFYEWPTIVNAIFDQLAQTIPPQVTASIYKLIKKLCAHDIDFTKNFPDNFDKKTLDLLNTAQKAKEFLDRRYLLESILGLLPFILIYYSKIEKSNYAFVREILDICFATPGLTIATLHCLAEIIYDATPGAKSLAIPEYIQNLIDCANKQDKDLQSYSLICLQNYSAMDDTTAAMLSAYNVYNIDYTQLIEDRSKKIYLEMMKNLALAELNVIDQYIQSPWFQYIIQTDFHNETIFYREGVAIIFARLLTFSAEMAKALITDHPMMLELVIDQAPSISGRNIYSILKMVEYLLFILNTDGSWPQAQYVNEMLHNEDFLDFLENIEDQIDIEKLIVSAHNIFHQLTAEQGENPA